MNTHYSILAQFMKFTYQIRFTYSIVLSQSPSHYQVIVHRQHSFFL